MRTFVARIDADVFGYPILTIETDRMGISESGDLLFYTDQGGVNRIGYAIAEGLWYSCTEIDKQGNSVLQFTFDSDADTDEENETLSDS